MEIVKKNALNSTYKEPTAKTAVRRILERHPKPVAGIRTACRCRACELGVA